MSDKPLYDELMNLVTEIGEMEVENRNLKVASGISKESITRLTMLIKDLKEQLLTQQILVSDLIKKIDGARFIIRLKYLFTRKL